MFDAVQTEGKVTARRVEWFDTGWLYLLREDAQRVALSHLDNLWKMEAQSDEMWLIEDERGPIMFIGVVPYTYLGASRYVWTFPFAAMEARHVRPVRRLIDANMGRFPIVVAQVVKGHTMSERFAKCFGLRYSYDNGNFAVYVREGQ